MARSFQEESRAIVRSIFFMMLSYSYPKIVSGYSNSLQAAAVSF